MKKELLSFVGAIAVLLVFTDACFAVQDGFLQNKGQIVNQHGEFNESVLFVFSGADYNVSLYQDHFSYEIFEGIGEDTVACERMELWFKATDRDPVISSISGYNTHTSYYKNGKEFKNIVSYDTITYSNVWNGVDLRFVISSGKLKYDLIVDASASRFIEFELRGAKVSVQNGVICYQLETHKILEKIPSVYIDIDQTRIDFHELRVSAENNCVKYKLPKSRLGTVVIDPIAYGLKYASFYGGSNVDYVNSVEALSDGSVVIGGYTLSTNNIATTGAYQTTIVDHDVFLAKFDDAGTRVWGTYFGGPGYDRSYAISVDDADNIIMTGNSFSSSGIATSGTHQQVLQSVDDAFLAKFDSAGQFLWGTYYGGNDHDLIVDVDADSLGQIYITGHTKSTNLIVTIDAHNDSLIGTESAFMAVFDSSGNQIHGTYYGFGDDDEGWGITATDDGFIYMAGYTSSSSDISFGSANQALYSGNIDGFLVKFSSSFVPVWGTYIGGLGTDQAFGICLDDSFNIYVTGNTTSDSAVSLGNVFQDTMNSTDDAFLMKFDSAGSKLWGTYIGGFGADYIYDIEESQNSLWIVGNTTSASLITDVDATFADNAGLYDNLVMRFDLNGNKIWATYTGGDQNDFAYDLAVLNDREIAIAGYSSSTNLNISSDAHQSAYGGQLYDGFWQKLCEPLSLTVLSDTGTQYICESDSFAVSSLNNFSSYNWSNGDTLNNTWVTIPGEYWLETEDSNACPGRSDTLTVVAVFTLSPIIVSDTNTICKEDSVSLNVDSSYVSYIWSTGDTAIQITVKDSGAYWAQVMDDKGCWHFTDTLFISFIPVVTSISVVGGTTLCANDSTVLEADSSLFNILWIQGDTTNAIYVDSAGNYSFVAMDTNNCIVVSDTLNISQSSTSSPVVLLNVSGTVTLCGNDSFVLEATSGYDAYAWSNGSDSSVIIVDSNGLYYVVVTDSMGCDGASDTVQVMLNLIPAPSIAPIDTGTVMCIQTNIFMGVTPAGYTEYLWSNGATFEQAVYEFNSAGSYSVSVQVLDSNNCSSSDSLEVTADECTGIGAGQPNDFLFNTWYDAGVLMVNSSINVHAITVIDILGRVVFTRSNLDEMELSLSVNQLVAGIYFVRAKLNDKSIKSGQLLVSP